MTDAVSNDELVRLIKEKRAQVEVFLSAASPRKRRLLNTTIVGGTLAAALTAAPAVGGQSFATWLTGTLGLTSPSWRLLCAAASISSITATVATQLLKSNKVEEYVAKGQGCRAKLQMLEVGLRLGQLDPKQATAEYLKCVEDAAFLEAP
jgi:MFS family permease